MTRAHVRLLGPCFKTGRMGYRRTATDPHAAPRLPVPTQRSPRALHAVPRAERHEERRRDAAACRLLGPLAGPPQTDCNARRRSDGSPFRRAHDGTSEPVVAPARGKCTRRPNAPSAPSPRGSRTRKTARRRAESRGSHSRPHPFASERFHVLLNSLFKVLFNFPSRYLSAIGLVSVFSLRWSLPPA